MLIDTHCHLYKSDYEDVDSLISEMKESNIYAIVNGCDHNTNEEVLELSKKHSNIYCAIGYHPSEIDSISNDYIKYIEDNIDSCVAIGEIGLDYYWVKDNKEEQIKLLKSQLDIAKKHNKPVIIHSRDATMDMYNILCEYNLKGVIHAFSGSYETAINYIKLGYKIGIGGVVTFKNTNLKEIVSKLDIHDIVLETDSPYLTPVPNRGKKNSPLNLRYIVEEIANIKEISYEEVVKITSEVATSLFDLNL